MKTDSVYYSFLLRIWKPDRHTANGWRLSLENPHDHQIKTYLDLDSLYRDLRALIKPACDDKKPPQFHD